MTLKRETLIVETVAAIGEYFERGRALLGNNPISLKWLEGQRVACSVWTETENGSNAHRKLTGTPPWKHAAHRDSVSTVWQSADV